MVNAATKKHRKRLHMLAKLQREWKDTKYLQCKIENNPPVKPNTERIKVELDKRFVDFRQGNHFDFFVQIDHIGNKRRIRLPIKMTRVSNKWNREGRLKQSIRLSTTTLTLYFEVEKTGISGTKVVGADQGKITCLSLSDSQVTKKNNHGHDLNSILKTMARRKKGSKGFQRAQEHRKNYINWSINQLNFNDIKEVRYERIMNLRKGKSTNREMSHWTYSQIKDKLIRHGEVKGFKVTEQDNKFMSQRCSQCGWVHKQNRKAKTFKCTNANCNYLADSDLNAACNHSVELIELPWSAWSEHWNRTTGFFWYCDSYVLIQESTVPVARENGVLNEVK